MTFILKARMMEIIQKETKHIQAISEQKKRMLTVYLGIVYLISWLSPQINDKGEQI